MADGVTIKIKGLQELGQRMQNLADNVQNQVARKATGAAAGVVLESALTKVPVRTGLLKSQLIVKRIPKSQANGNGATSMHIVTARQGTKKRKGKLSGTGAPHAHLLEFGTVHMSARPFLRPALDENVSRAIEVMTGVLRSGIFKAEPMSAVSDE